MQQTQVDLDKALADFRLIAIDGIWHSIIWKDGRRESIKGVRAFNKVAQGKNWVTDF